MDRIDSNKDGKLDLDEFLVLFNEMLVRYSLLERARAKFQELDADKSGFLESAELDKVVAWSLEAFTGDNPDVYKAKLMVKIDANNDGKLDMAEFIVLFEEMLIRLELLQQATKKFNELDVDKSGFLEKGEIDKLVEIVLLAYVEKPVKEREQFRKTLVDRIDKNKDGKLDLKEFTDLWEEMMGRLDLIEKAKVQFKALDSDNSGFLEPAELTPVVQKWAATCKAQTAIDLEAELSDLLTKVDVNGDGKLNLLEFTEVFEGILSQGGLWN